MARFIGRTGITRKVNDIVDRDIADGQRGIELSGLGLKKIADKDDFPAGVKCRQWAMTQLGFRAYAMDFCSGRTFHFLLARGDIPGLEPTEDPEEADLIGYLSYTKGELDFVKTARDADSAGDMLDHLIKTEEITADKPYYNHFGLLKKIEGEYFVDSKFSDSHVFRHPLKFDYFSSYVDFFKKVDIRREDFE